jgi:hypothetical protein
MPHINEALRGAAGSWTRTARERVVAAALELYETEYSRARYESKIRQLLEVLR